ncbi:MAG: BBE domain-containing protein [Candidatus Dadabacteria bacterium]|jgi:hypothetical protein
MEKERVVPVKNKYDSKNLFRTNYNVKPTV